MNTQPHIKRLKLTELYIDKRYQRPLDEARVARMAKNFEPALCGVLEVSSGNNGSYAVFDGQHRFAALKLLGEPSWLCRIHTLEAKQQAELFVRLQTERRPVTPLDRHKAAVFAKDPTALQLKALVEDAGYSITSNHVMGALSCVAALNKCLENYGPEALRSALGVIEEAWTRNDHYARKAPMVSGMTLLLCQYSDVLDTKVLVEKLRRVPAAQITREASSERKLGAGTTERVLVARALLEAYNVKRRHLTEEEIAEGKTSQRISPSKLGRGA